MRLLLALVLLLVLAPAASADTFVVNESGDQPDANSADGACDRDAVTANDQCTLRAAIEQADGTPGGDTIELSGLNQPITVATALAIGADPTCTDVNPCPVTINDDGGAPVRWAGMTGPLLQVAPLGRGTRLQGVRLENAGGTGTLLQIQASNVEGNFMHVTGANGDGIRVESGAQQVGLNSPAVSGNSGDGIEVAGSAVTITAAQVDGNGEQGIEVVDSGQNVVIARSNVFANPVEPISLAPGANGGIQPPQGLRVGPRRADGTLPVTGGLPGPAAGGTVELFMGNPFGGSPIAFFAGVAAPGDSFSYVPAPELAPGAAIAATVTGSTGTSEFATAVVPSDVVSPDLVGGVATSTTEVRIQASEPLDPASVQAEDFLLDMAGQRRQVSGIEVLPGGAEVILRSSGWTHGEAGFVQLAAAGAVADAVGNASLATTRLRVAAAPGDLLSPVASSLAIRPRRICLTRGRGCRRTGARVSFVASEPGRGRLVILRGNRRVGVDDILVEAGRNVVRFTGRIGNRKLRPGPYRMLLYLEDPVGNVTAEPPIRLFTVKRTTRSRRARR